MQLVTCMSAEHEVAMDWCNQLGDCNPGVITCKSDAFSAGTFLQLGVCEGQSTQDGGAPALYRFAVMPHQTLVKTLWKYSHQELDIAGSDKAYALTVLWR